MKHLINTLLLVSIIGCTSAQNPPTEPAYQTVLPGDASLVPSRIKPHKVRYKKTGASMIYIMKEITRNGSQAYEIAIYFNQDENGTPDLMYFDKETLGYLGRRMAMKDYTLEVAFADNRFTGELNPTSGSDFKPRTYDKAYPHGAFEPAIINYFIAALPLAEDYTASMPVFDLNKGSQMFWANIEVVGRETIKANGRTYDTWKVVSNSIKRKTIWVSTTEPYAVKMKTKGNSGTWEVLDY